MSDTLTAALVAGGVSLVTAFGTSYSTFLL
jgi:hypothetical protein